MPVATDFACVSELCRNTCRVPRCVPLIGEGAPVLLCQLLLLRVLVLVLVLWLLSLLLMLLLLLVVLLLLSELGP